MHSNINPMDWINSLLGLVKRLLSLLACLAVGWIVTTWATPFLGAAVSLKDMPMMLMGLAAVIYAVR